MQQPRPGLASGASVFPVGPSLNKIEINRIILRAAAADQDQDQAESANGLNLLGTVHQLSYLIFIRPKTRQCHTPQCQRQCSGSYVDNTTNWFLLSTERRRPIATTFGAKELYNFGLFTSRHLQCPGIK